jgi:hypothetical protein
MTHPLTDEMCLELSGFTLDDPDYGVEWLIEDMRAAYDLAIDRCIERLSEEAFGVVMARRLREAMRPQQQENN